jgi:photosystem II stability/assembly factor-like uncharacterized protein
MLSVKSMLKIFVMFTLIITAIFLPTLSLAKASVTSNDLNDIYMLDSKNGWIVGDSGTILHWNGNSWATQQSPTTANLVAVDFSNSNDGWAVGERVSGYSYDGSVLLHWNGVNWVDARARNQCSHQRSPESVI